VRELFELNPLPGALGAEIRGVDLGADIADDVIDRLRQRWLEHRVLFFRGQELDPGELAEFGRRFGPLEHYPFVEPLPGHPEVIPVIKEPDERANFGGGWHTDLVYRTEPSAATMLHAVEVPARGGDTLFADGVLAYEALSDRMRELLGGLRVVYHVANVRRHVHDRSDGESNYSRSMIARAAPEEGHASPAHPVVRTHPETGRRSLYFSREHTERFEGMTIAESRPLLDWLEAHMTQPVFTTRFHWEPGSLAFWDNRCVSHYALNDYAGERRHMHRITIAGDAPF
jgi:taurine dioxygenase